VRDAQDVDVQNVCPFSHRDVLELAAHGHAGVRDDDLYRPGEAARSVREAGDVGVTGDVTANCLRPPALC
jgi:hypothetical protein